MDIRQMTNKDLTQARVLYNNITSSDWLFETLSEKEFSNAFLPTKYIKSFVCEVDNKLVGFSSGTFNETAQKAYITMVLVQKEYQSKGIGTQLLDTLNCSFQKDNQTLQSIDIVFFNPVHLPWILPINKKYIHPNIPGVYNDSVAFNWFLKQGFKAFAIQDVYYKSLQSLETFPSIEKTIDSLKKEDISITFYKKDTHIGLDTLFDALDNPSWKQAVHHGLSNNLELPVVTHHNTVIGFAGPIKVEPSKRGYFAGIGVHPNYRNKGIASALFYTLCKSLSSIGAEYMTLFTGRDNKAKYVYKKIGFQQAASFTNYRLERNNEKNI